LTPQAQWCRQAQEIQNGRNVRQKRVRESQKRAGKTRNVRRKRAFLENVSTAR
jgi:hypothetical protein